jgi:transglutaminase-like putative cysteine protease
VLNDGNKPLRQFNSIPCRPAVALITILIVTALLILSGCSTNSDEIAAKVSKNVDFMTRDNPDRLFNGEDVKPVTDLIDGSKSGSSGSSDPDTGDVLNIDMQYKIKPESSSDSRGILDSMPWNKPRMVLTTLIPKSIPNKQSVLFMDFSYKPSRVFDVGDNRYAEFEINEVTGVEMVIHITASIQLFQYDLQTAMVTGIKGFADKAKLGQYLVSEDHIEKNNPLIINIAGKMKGVDDVETVRNIFKYVTQTMTYDDAKAKDELSRASGAVKALKQGRGVCVDYADLFIALCRANRIPARYLGGIVTEDKVTTRGHAWVEVYLKSAGWVPFDPTWGDTGAATFNSMRPSYVYFTNVRNDEVIDNSNIFAYRYYGNREIDVAYEALIDSGRHKFISDLKTTIDEKRKELNQIKGNLSLTYADIERDKQKLESKKAELAAMEASLKSASGINSIGNIENARKTDEFNTMALEYNSEIRSYNEKVAEYEQYRKYYETKRTEFNALVDKYNSVR